MYKYLSIFLLGFVAVTTASMSQADNGYRSISGVFQIYGGGLGDPVTATKKDAKIAISIKGQAALEMFNAMGPDAKDLCTQGSGIRIRKKDHDNLVCMRSVEGQFTCSFGFDLKSGKSIGGSLC